jgi:hypothetical protein
MPECSIESSTSESNTYVPSQKELEQFDKDKRDAYKGTFIVCLVYGLIALGMILAILLTDWGREYIYGKMLPAVATFVFGALFIIIYLAFMVYDLKPRRIVNKTEMDSDIVCPDYWKLELVNEREKVAIVDNNIKGKVIPSIKTVADDTLRYKCRMDPEVLETATLVRDENLLYHDRIFNYKNGYRQDNTNKVGVDYVYVDASNTLYPSDSKLVNYAKLSGIYNDTSSAAADAASTIKEYTVKSAVDADNDVNFYKTKRPLICNTVYPQVLASMDKDTPEKNKYRCMYAKACNIPWTDIGCKYDAPPSS